MGHVSSEHLPTIVTAEPGKKGEGPKLEDEAPDDDDAPPSDVRRATTVTDEELRKDPDTTMVVINDDRHRQLGLHAVRRVWRADVQAHQFDGTARPACDRLDERRDARAGLDPGERSGRYELHRHRLGLVP